MINDLFDGIEAQQNAQENMAEGAVLLRGQAVARADDLLAAIDKVSAASPFRNMVTPGGHVMSVAMTNCGQAGWVTDRSGYRYDGIDPETGQPWPAMPRSFASVATEAAAKAG